MVGFIGSPLFTPIVPARVYDSRKNNAPTPNGKLATGANRVVPVKDGRHIESNSVQATNVVPAGAKAIAYNVTVASTIGGGFLSIGPGDQPGIGSSAINWDAGTGAIANAGIVAIDGSRRIKVFGGGGSTDFIVDVTAYYT